MNGYCLKQQNENQAELFEHLKLVIGHALAVTIFRPFKKIADQSR